MYTVGVCYFTIEDGLLKTLCKSVWCVVEVNDNSGDVVWDVFVR